MTLVDLKCQFALDETWRIGPWEQIAHLIFLNKLIYSIHLLYDGIHFVALKLIYSADIPRICPAVEINK